MGVFTLIEVRTSSMAPSQIYIYIYKELKISCKRYEEISTNIFQRQRGLKRECLMNIFFKLIYEMNNYFLGVMSI